MHATAELINESNVLIRVSNTLTPNNITQMIHLNQAISELFGAAFIDSIQSFTSLMISFNPLLLHPAQALNDIELLLLQIDVDQSILGAETETFTLPVFYDISVGLDLENLTKRLNLSIDEIIAIHSSKDYDVYSLGFSPGFAFMGKLPDPLKLARKKNPRQRIPSGSVAIAEYQTTVYPNATPGGWHIIGRCPTVLFNTQNTPANTLTPGQKIRFKPIDKTTFIELGGKLEH